MLDNSDKDKDETDIMDVDEDISILNIRKVDIEERVPSASQPQKKMRKNSSATNVITYSNHKAC